MGKKTDKKIKSDRINILRKQYDAFLEEDKKRKDRNEYILGKLDKMRSSTAIQLQQSPSQYGGFNPISYTRHAHRPDSEERCNMQLISVNQQISRPASQSQLGVTRNFIQNNMLLKEISKKYILIPKLSAMYPSDNPTEVIPPLVPDPVPTVKSTDIDNNDWKSKYDILEQLKKNEKEGETKRYANNDELFHNKEPITNGTLDRTINIEHVMQSYNTESLSTKFEDEIPEKDIPDQLDVEDQLKSIQKCTINDDINHAIGNNASQVKTNNYANTQGIVYDQNSSEVDTNVEHNLEPAQYDIPHNEIVETDYNTNSNVEYHGDEYLEQEFQPQQDYLVGYEQNLPIAETNVNHTNIENVAFVEHEQNEYIPIEVINPTELVEEINRENVVKEAVSSENEYPVETAYTQEYAPNDSVVMQDEHNMDPENYVAEDGTIVENNPVPQMTENPPDNSGIEEFDAEQREMFYSEQTDPNYAYDQHGGGDVYNQEYGQNETYPQTQEYAYYEGAEQEQGTIPVEINEHEETQQLYDQQYEQQYAPNYEQGYEQQQVYMEQDPNQQQFEQPALYDEQQEFGQYDQHQAETQEQVEQVLDREDGYVEKQMEEKPDGTVPKAEEQNIP